MARSKRYGNAKRYSGGTGVCTGKFVRKTDS